ncbi:succinate dehydrogenase/fumarate reductase flavoprotein subunit [Leucobacter luti]|uniref:3-ketosteroid-delta-1-dehydrogenase n=1 Tax=Leucobacter luti TaxID=340320 RepID=UPI0010519AAF|nr:3-ketosteroid-delta-1-dehydrogenase [Leucobacter luti]MCW2289683.1 succinate dehydrogenase/fumarate reductase flavoprotein subunit [Leucobacter luti]TCK37854.1 succinate dehydrogenase/fumarate reductase flavoprotein subunit [Leucobacter luti]
MSAPNSPAPQPIDRASVDLLVIGSGTGLTTALAAHELGLEVAVAEKTLLVGGSTARSGGAFWIPGNPVLVHDGAVDSVERAAEYLTAAVQDSSPRARWQTVLDHGAETVEMLQRTTELSFTWVKGYADYFPQLPGGSAQGRSVESRPFDLRRLGSERARLQPEVMSAPFPMPVTGANYKWLNLIAKQPLRVLPMAMKRGIQGVGGLALGREYAAGGQALAGGMYDGAIRAGIPIWTGAELIDLVREGTRVVGARLRQGDAEVTVLAKYGVVLAAGGFDHNMRMRREYQSPALVADLSLGAKGNTGDAIQIAERAGAAIGNMDQAWWFPAVAPVGEEPPQILLAERSLPGSIIVDSSGRRFINEATGYMSFGQEVLRRERAGDPVGNMWMVFDQRYRNSYLYAGQVFPRMALPPAWYEAGIAHRASSVAGLAGAIGVPAAALAETIARFNSHAGAGTDSDFGRGESAYDRYYGDPTNFPNPCLRELDERRLYAVQIVISDLGTCGGILADGTGRVLDQAGAPISGLFTQGNSAANVFGSVYPGAGATIGQGLVYGVVIANEVARIAQGASVGAQ